MKELIWQVKAWYKELDRDTRTLVWVVVACFTLLAVVVLV